MSGPLAPRFWPAHALALACVVAAGLLGWWQLDSWQARRAAETVDLTAVAPVPLVDVIGPDDPFPGDRVGQPVTVAGTWVPDATVFVSGRAHDGVDGFWMTTPLTTADDAALPVVLGWVADPATAPAAPVGDSGDLVAYLQPPEGTGAVDADPTDRVVPQLRAADVVQLVDADLYSAYAVAREGIDGLPAGDLEALPEVGVFTALRNLLYAVEWWVFGGFAAFIWWRFVRDGTRPALEPEGDPEDDPVASPA